MLNNFFEDDVVGPAVTHWGQAPRGWLVALGLIVAITEVIRADRGFVEPGKNDGPYPEGVKIFEMRDEHVAGNADFDPWGLRDVFASDSKRRLQWTFDFRPGFRYPVTERVETTIEDNFKLMQTRELNNGRLAMLAIMAVFTQEELYGKPFDYDFIHVESCLTPASCTKLVEGTTAAAASKVDVAAEMMPPSVVQEAP